MSNHEVFAKEEAIKLMHQGIKITHRYFDPSEWMLINSKNQIELEDGVKCSIEEFFRYRNTECWDNGYKIYK